MNCQVATLFLCLLVSGGMPAWANSSSNTGDATKQSESSGPSKLAVTGKAQGKSLQQRWVSAIANDRASRIATLLATGDAAGLIPLRSSNGKSALMVACKAGELTLARRLVMEGADVNAQTATGGTPFMFAVLGDHLAVAQWLHTQSVSIDTRGSNGWTAMTIAAAKGQWEMLRWLLSIKANANVSDVYQFTPLMRAVDNGHLSSAQLLIGADGVDVNAADESGNTGLHHATANGDLLMVRLLLNNGADAGKANRAGITPADIARANDESSSLLALFGRD